MQQVCKLPGSVKRQGHCAWDTACAFQGKLMTAMQQRQAVVHLYIWLALDPVEILVQAIQQESQQLLAVLLAVSLKLRGKPPKLVFEIGRRDRCSISLQTGTTFQSVAAVYCFDPMMQCCVKAALSKMMLMTLCRYSSVQLLSKVCTG